MRLLYFLSTLLLITSCASSKKEIEKDYAHKIYRTKKYYNSMKKSSFGHPVFSKLVNSKFLKFLSEEYCNGYYLKWSKNKNDFERRGAGQGDNKKLQNCLSYWASAYIAELDKEYPLANKNLDSNLDCRKHGCTSWKGYEDMYVKAHNDVIETVKANEIEKLYSNMKSEFKERKRVNENLLRASLKINKAMSSRYKSSKQSNNYKEPANNYGKGGRLYSDDGEFLGNVNDNQYDPNSIANPYGQYGSHYSTKSINNPYSEYGNKYSPNYVPNQFRNPSNNNYGGY